MVQLTVTDYEYPADYGRIPHVYQSNSFTERTSTEFRCDKCKKEFGAPKNPERCPVKYACKSCDNDLCDSCWNSGDRRICSHNSWWRMDIAAHDRFIQMRRIVREQKQEECMQRAVADALHKVTVVRQDGTSAEKLISELTEEDVDVGFDVIDQVERRIDRTEDVCMLGALPWVVLHPTMELQQLRRDRRKAYIARNPHVQIACTSSR